LSLAPRSTVDSAFWQAQAQRFGALRQVALTHSKRLLGASYHPGGWELEAVGAFTSRCQDHWLLDRGSVAIVDELKGIAGVCAVALGSANTDDAWAEWLDCLRREGVDFKPGETSVSFWAEEPRPDPDFEVIARGLWYPPPEKRPDPDPVHITHDLGEIDDVCGASERVCRRLADEALKSELTTQAAETIAEAQIGRQSAPDAEIVSAARGTTAPAKSSRGFRRPALGGIYDPTFGPDGIFGSVLPVADVESTVSSTESRTPPPPDTSRAMTVKQAAKALNVSEDTLQRLRKQQKIKMFMVGSR
jgi:excisionase family DNA binding protein